MAQKVITQLVDDIDGTELDPDIGETVNFAFDGQTYEIDLSPANAATLRNALGTYIAAGRRVGKATSTKPRRSTSTSGPSAAELREWARSNGFTVPDRGRIPREVRDAFDKQ